MCGRYVILDVERNFEIKKIITEINERYLDRPERVEMRTGEIFPTNTVPILVPSEEGGIQAVLMKWGYPRWDAPGVVINARGENAGAKALFRLSLSTQRCLIPASGFFEWSDSVVEKKKDKFFFHLPEDPIMYMAGIYSKFADHKTDKQYTAFVILTTAANSYVAPIHDRMPIIIRSDRLQSWLYDNKETNKFLRQMGPTLTTSALVKIPH